MAPYNRAHNTGTHPPSPARRWDPAPVSSSWSLWPSSVSPTPSSPVQAGSLPPPPIPADPVPAAPTSPRSEGYVETELDEDRFHGYRMPVPKGDAQRVIRCGPECFICPVCPNKKPRKSMNDMEKHVLSSARPYDDKFSSRHRRVARNHGWMAPLPQQQQ
ncbi:hypothetical protein EJB05_54688, partial [Eragrostis curvula]